MRIWNPFKINRHMGVYSFRKVAGDNGARHQITTVRTRDSAGTKTALKRVN